MFSRKGLIHVLFLVSCILFPVLVLAQATSIHSFIPAGKLIADDGSAGHNFGHALDIDGQTAAIGAPSWNNTGNTYQGAAYIYTSAGGGWKAT